MQMPSKDKEYGDCYFDITKTKKRLIRATLKTYENTGTYVFLKLFMRKDNEYEFEQRTSLTTEKFDKLMKKKWQDTKLSARVGREKRYFCC